MTSGAAEADRIQRLEAMRERMRADSFNDHDDSPSPIWWPALTAEEAEAEWNPLRRWVHELRIRFPNGLRIPDCWWRHNDLVEALSALRDYERACFSPTAPATAAVEWHRAFRDMSSCMEMWIKRFTCFVADRGHDVPTPNHNAPDGWAEFVAADVQARRQRDQPLSLAD